MKRFRVVAMTGWGYATGARERRYEVNGTPVVVRRESQGPHVVVAYLRGLTACDDEWRAAHPPMIEEGEKGLVAPVVEEKTRPKYPAEAREVRAEAAVILEAVIREDGSVGDLCVVRADNRSLGFAREAVAAVRRWRYRPAMKDGVPVELMMTIAVTFSLH